MNFLRKLIAVAVLASPLSAFAATFPIATSGDGLKVLVDTIMAVKATYQGNSASYSNDLYLVTNDGLAGNDIFLFNNHTSAVQSMVNLGSFAVGRELEFRLYVNDTKTNYYTGAASRNPGNHIHARVQQNWAFNT